jgi:hypothetical protein
MFDPDELIISTHPPGRSNWLERGLIEVVRAAYDLPITHVVVDLEAEAVSGGSRARSNMGAVPPDSVAPVSKFDTSAPCVLASHPPIAPRRRAPSWNEL